MGEKKKKGSISYAKWGYIFIAPFFIIFAVFQLIPLASTIYYSFFEYYRSGLKIIGPNFVGLKNYITLFATDLPKYFGNTLILWIIGFIPQIAISPVAGSMVHRSAPEVEGPDLLQDGHLHAQPDYGLRLCNAVLRAVLGQRPGERRAAEHGLD